jgi:hypothetical protein
MSLLNEASFLVTPNGYKEDKLYAAIPTNGDGDMTFTRAGTATRVNEAGLIELVPYNLLSRSEEFSNAAWGKYFSTVTANTVVAPDGTLTGDKLVEDTNANYHYIQSQTFSAVSGTSYTQSWFIKAAGRTTFYLQYVSFSGFATGLARFNLDDVSVENTGTATGTITAVGNGWFRATLSQAATSNATNAKSQLALQTISYTGDGTSGIYIWGAQIVKGTSALTYQKTVDRLDIPRIDYTGGGCPSILLEPQRTNLFTYSEDFSQWNSFRSTVTPNATTSPDGTINADLVNQDYPPTTGHGGVNQAKAVSTGVKYTYSLFVKKKEYSWIELSENATSTGNNSTWFDVEDGVVGTVGAGCTAQIEDFGNDWYRCSISFTSAFTGSRNFNLYLTTGNGSTYANIVGGAYIFGGQLEAGAYPTSYIPTTIGTVTRNADVISKTGISDLLNPSEGTFYAEISALANDLTYRMLSLSDGTGDNGVQIALGNASNQIRLDTFGGGASYRSAVTVSDTTENHKVLVKWGPSGIFGFIDGDKYTFFLATGTGSGIPAALNRINFSQWWGGNSFYVKCKGVQIYKTALSDPQCKALTTL